MSVRVTISQDGTRKYAFGLGGELQAEAAFFRVPGRERPNIACVSTQVGCAVGCPFCATARSPFVRDLTTEGILLQIASIVDDQCAADIFREGFEVSFMGMGEPLANLRNLLAAIREVRGRYPEITRVSVSTAGPAMRIERLTEAMPASVPVHLQVSLHATSDEVRRKLIPRAPETIANLLEAGWKFHQKTGDQVFLNYVLLKGINDRDQDARWLAKLDREAFYLKISALNRVAGLPSDLVPASMSDIQRFSAILTSEGAPHKVFVGDGLDVLASCGQLAARPLEVSVVLMPFHRKMGDQESAHAGHFADFRRRA